MTSKTAERPAPATYTAPRTPLYPSAMKLDDVIRLITAGKPLPPRTSPMLPTILASSASDGLQQIIAGPAATTYR